MDKNTVQETYEKIADWMDQQRSRELFEKLYLDQAISYLKPKSQVLDLGCGTGEPIGQYFADSGFQVTGIDASTKMLAIAKKRCPKITFIQADMRKINLGKKFDCIIAWHSFFHLSPADQRSMFQIFTTHLNNQGILLFTSGPDAGEVWSNNGGEQLYHASLSTAEYKEFLEKYGFLVLAHKVEDPKCNGATIWLAQKQL